MGTVHRSQFTLPGRQDSGRGVQRLLGRGFRHGSIGRRQSCLIRLPGVGRIIFCFQIRTRRNLVIQFGAIQHLIQVELGYLQIGIPGGIIGYMDSHLAANHLHGGRYHYPDIVRRIPQMQDAVSTAFAGGDLQVNPVLHRAAHQLIHGEDIPAVVQAGHRLADTLLKGLGRIAHAQQGIAGNAVIRIHYLVIDTVGVIHGPAGKPVGKPGVLDAVGDVLQFPQTVGNNHIIDVDIAIILFIFNQFNGVIAGLQFQVHIDAAPNILRPIPVVLGKGNRRSRIAVIHIDIHRPGAAVRTLIGESHRVYTGAVYIDIENNTPARIAQAGHKAPAGIVHMVGGRFPMLRNDFAVLGLVQHTVGHGDKVDIGHVAVGIPPLQGYYVFTLLQIQGGISGRPVFPTAIGVVRIVPTAHHLNSFGGRRVPAGPYAHGSIL